jgi:hypothetical protein
MSRNIGPGRHLKGSKTQIFKICFEQVRILPEYQGQWIMKGQWVEIVNQRCTKSLGSVELTMAHTQIYANIDLTRNIVNEHNLYRY